MPIKTERTTPIDIEQLHATMADLHESQASISKRHIEELCNQEDTQFDHALLIYLHNETDPVIFFDKLEINVGRGRGHHNPDLNLEHIDANQSGVSRLHAQIIFDGEQYVIQDLHSTNGTWLNNKKLDPYQPLPIANDAIILCANVAMRVYNITC